jgi:hypothetical protein
MNRPGNPATSDPPSVPLAVRVYPEAPKQERERRWKKPWELPDAMLVFDTETRTDVTQSLLFGSYRYFIAGEFVEEGLFRGDNLTNEERLILERYVEAHRGDVPGLLTRQEFLRKFFQYAYRDRCLIVGLVVLR